MFQIASSEVGHGASGATHGAAEHGLGVVPEHFKLDVGGFFVNADTVVATWISMAVAIVVVLVLTKSLQRKPDGKQTVAESVVEFIEGLLKDEMGNINVFPYVPFIGSLFLFVLFSNWIGILPWRLLHLAGVPLEIASPTNDLNTTGGLALISVMSYFYFGIKKKGLSYFKHYKTPHPSVFFFNDFEDFKRHLSLAFRLFGKIIGGEILLGILLFLVPWFIPLPIFAFEVFVGFIQAFVFAVLTTSYIGAGVTEHHHDDHAHEGAH